MKKKKREKSVIIAFFAFAIIIGKMSKLPLCHFLKTLLYREKYRDFTVLENYIVI